MSTAKRLQDQLYKIADPTRAEHSARFFKTAKGEYGYGDVFLGITVPAQRRVARDFVGLPLTQIQILLQSKTHEHRLSAVFILVVQYKKADAKHQKAIYDFYLKNTRYINNWDIVDSSAEQIVGSYLRQMSSQSRTNGVLSNLAKSQDIWQRRIAIMATFAFIKHGEFEPTFEIAKILLHDEHDLIQKAVGWMLREVGKRISTSLEEEFLLEDGRYKTMPRTMLRYAIEHFEPSLRKKYLGGSA